MPIRDVAMKTYRKQWTIGTGGEKRLRVSVLMARHHDDDDADIFSFVLFYGISTIVGYFHAISIFYTNKQFYFKQFSLAKVCSLNVKTGLFQAIQFSIRNQFGSIWPIDRTLSGLTTSGQSGPGNDGSEGVLRISRSSISIGALPSDYLVAYPGHLLKESYPSAGMQLVYSTALADWAIYIFRLHI